MSTDAEMAARGKALLSEFAELAMDLARDLHASAKSAETPEEKARLAQEFHRVGRSLRQSLALQARLVRAEARDAADAARRAREADMAAAKEAVGLRRRKLTAAVERLIWTEYEGDEAREFEDLLSDRLDDAETDDDFLIAPVEILIARLCEQLGLAPPARPDLTFDASD